MHRPYWIMCYIMSYMSDLCLIASGSPSNVSLPISILPYPTLPLTIPPIPLYSCHPPPPLLLHAPLLSLEYLERSATTIALIFTVPVSAKPPDKIP